MPDKRIYFFGEGSAEGNPERKDLLGGKGASLAAMSRAGLPVPPGFTIATECCREFLDSGGRWPEGLEDEVAEHLARLEKAVGRRYGDPKAPLLVSVRSGAAHSMPGMMDTLLNCGLAPAMAEAQPDPAAFWRVYRQFVVMFAGTVAGMNIRLFEELDDPDALKTAPELKALTDRCLALYEKTSGQPFPTDPRAALKACIEAVFRSWNTERAVTYRREHDIRGLIGTAVNVQAMFPSEISGIVFTVNPNRVEAGEMIIESSYGLGEAVVSGDVQPDKFVVDRKSLALKDSAIGRKTAVVRALGDGQARDPNAPSLAEAHIRELAQMAMKVEAFYDGQAMDLEWGLADGRFSLLQARAIRGLDIARDVEQGRQEEIERLRKMAAGQRKVWVRHNLDEILPSPTPLTWDIVKAFMSGSGGFGRMYRDLGYRQTEEVNRDGFLELIGGRIYADPDRAAGLFYDLLPVKYNVEAVARDPKLMDAAPDQFAAEKADGRFLRALPRIVLDAIRSSKTRKRIARTVADRFEQEIVPPFLRWVEEKKRQDLTALSVPELIAEIRARIETGLHEIGREELKPGLFGGMAHAKLEARLCQLMGESEGRSLALLLTQGLEGDTTIEQNEALFQLAKGQGTRESFLEKYGHRGVGEMELAKPPYREDDSYLKQVIASFLADGIASPSALHSQNAGKRKEAETKLPETLAPWGGSSFLEEITETMREAQRLLPYRERGKDFLIMGYDQIRRAIAELARRWDLGRDIYFLGLDELDAYATDPKPFDETIARRKVRWQSARRLDMADVVDTDALETLGQPREYEAAEELEGEPVASGMATGPALIVFDPQEVASDCTNYILVCPSTDPSWTALFVHARGVIVEKGGVLSHGAIVSRDFGIPAVVCPDATRRIPAGATIRVDGNRGVITLIEKEPAHA